MGTGNSTRDRLEHFRGRYADLKPGWTSSTALFQRRVADRLTARSHVLDLGCGRGGIVERLGDRGHWIGVDPDFVSLTRHRRPTLPRACTRSEALPFADGSFDVVTASWVLEHLLAPQRAFREIARVLRPGGRFLFLTPNAQHPLPRLSMALAAMVRLQARLVLALYRRAPADTFPVTYRANTSEAIEKLGAEAGLRLHSLTFVDDPTYLAWSEVGLAAIAALELLTPAGRQIHLVGELTKPG